jgi:hypothetical protein
MRRGWLVVLLVWGCRGAPGNAGSEAAADTIDPDSAALAVIDTVLPPMPNPPRRRSGHLVVVAAGALDSTWAWPMKAGRCARPPMVFMVPRELGQSGASVLLELPDGELAGDYPVRFADSTGMPDPPAAMLGFQFVDEQRADAYQAAEGMVSIGRLDDTRISGTFQATVRHIVSNRRAQVAGVFHDIEIEALDLEYCGRLQAAQDSAGGAI